jgi:hypothetical protein
VTHPVGPWPALVTPARVFSRSDVLARPSPVPDVRGVYAWYFAEIPGQTDLSNTVKLGNLTLLYVGISPRKPPIGGESTSKQNLRKRIRYHYRGNAYGSTLRLTLGCLLADRLKIQLRRVGSGTRMTFSDGEPAISAWMAENAFVCWHESVEPWLIEDELIRTIDLPLNLAQNSHHAFHAELTQLRTEQKARAKELPVLLG